VVDACTNHIGSRKPMCLLLTTCTSKIFCTATRQNKYFLFSMTRTIKYLRQTSRRNKYFLIFTTRTAETVAQEQKQHDETVAQQLQKQLEKTAQMKGLEINPTATGTSWRRNSRWIVVARCPSSFKYFVSCMCTAPYDVELPGVVGE
jgi:hypothetical protein